MADLVPQIPPARAAVIQQGPDTIPRFTRAWYRYLQILQRQTASDIDSMATESFAVSGSYVDPTLSNAIQDVSAMYSEIRELRELVFSMRKEIDALQQGVTM